MRIEAITNEDALRGLAPEWDRLADRIIPWTPFRTATWNLLHWQYFRRNGPLTRDDLRTLAVRDAAGRLVAVAPMMLTSWPGVGPALVRQLHFFGVDANLTELRGLVCLPEDEAPVTAALLRHLHAENGKWDWLRWSGLSLSNPSLPSPREMIRPAMSASIPMYCVEPTGTWEAFKSALPRNTKEALRKCYNSLKRDGHAFTFEVVTRPEDAYEALTRFFELHAARAEVKSGVFHSNAFAATKARGFLRAYAKAMAEWNRLRIFRLRIGNTVVATRVAFCGGGDLYLYYSGYLPKWGGYSVMTTATVEAMKWAMERGTQRINLSVGSDASKLRWRPRKWEYLETVQSAPTLRGRATLAAFQLVQRMRKTSVFHEPSPAEPSPAGPSPARPSPGP